MSEDLIAIEIAVQTYLRRRYTTKATPTSSRLFFIRRAR